MESFSTGQRRDRITGDIQPWYTHPALNEIEQWDVRTKTVLEWGGGFSSLWWAKRCFHIFTIEADATWCQWISTEAAARGITNITIMHREKTSSSSEFTNIPSGCMPDIVVVD